MNIEHLIILTSPSIISKTNLIIRFTCTISGNAYRYMYEYIIDAAVNTYRMASCAPSRRTAPRSWGLRLLFFAHFTQVIQVAIYFNRTLSAELRPTAFADKALASVGRTVWRPNCIGLCGRCIGAGAVRRRRLWLRGGLCCGRHLVFRLQQYPRLVAQWALVRMEYTREPTARALREQIRQVELTREEQAEALVRLLLPLWLTHQRLNLTWFWLITLNGCKKNWRILS